MSRPTCQIKWIDNSLGPVSHPRELETPDQNPAVGFCWTETVKDDGTRKFSDIFPICEDHLTRLPQGWYRGLGGSWVRWVYSPIDPKPGASDLDLVEVYFLVIGDGYLAAAELCDESNTSRKFWGIDLDYTPEDSPGLYYAIVPRDDADRLTLQGTSGQVYSDGYDAWQAVLQLADPEFITQY